MLAALFMKRPNLQAVPTQRQMTIREPTEPEAPLIYAEFVMRDIPGRPGLRPSSGLSSGMYITGLGTATPSRRYLQKECWDAVRSAKQFCQLTSRSRAI